MADLEAFLRTVDGAQIERDARIPDEVYQGLAELGCFGMKIPVEYGGLGLSTAYYGRANVPYSIKARTGQGSESVK